jgi:hypothetical protein
MTMMTGRAGGTTTAAAQRRTRSRGVQQIVGGTVHEGYHQVFIGIDERRPFAVERSEGPQRVVVDICREGRWPPWTRSSVDHGGWLDSRSPVADVGDVGTLVVLRTPPLRAGDLMHLTAIAPVAVRRSSAPPANGTTAHGPYGVRTPASPTS